MTAVADIPGRPPMSDFPRKVTSRAIAAGIVLFGLLGPFLARADPPIMIPDDPDAIVLTFDREGGGPESTLRVRRGPYLTLRAGGRVTVDGPTWRSKVVEGKIGADEVRDLLRFAIEECRFFDYDGDRVRAAIRRKQDAKQLVRGFHFPEIVIRIKLADRELEARRPPVSPVAAIWPDDPELAIIPRLDALEARLSRVMARVYAGGDAAVAAALRLANDHLARPNHAGPILTAEHLSHAQQWNDGSAEVQFFLPGSKPFHGITVQVETPTVGPPAVSVRGESGSP